MKQREQHGTICQISDRWYVRFNRLENVGGQLVRKRRSYCLGPVTTRGTRPPDDVRKAATTYLQSNVNNNSVPAQQMVRISKFIEDVYLPRVEKEKRQSTVKGYRDLYRCHVKPIVSRESMCLRDVRTPHVQRWLDSIAREELAGATLRHIKAWLSGVFRFAIQQDYYDRANPVREASVPKSSVESEEPHAYSLDEVNTILSLLPSPSDTVFALAAFAGLRFAELQGLNWEDFRDGDLWISRSIWNGHVNDPKTRKSKAPVSVIKPLAQRLEMHRLRCGNKQTGPMFANSLPDGRLNLNNLLARVMLPALNRCVHCHGENGKSHLKQSHDWQRDESIPRWRGWHAARRGLASNLNRLGIDDEVIQRILRHSSVQVTQTHYIKTSSQDVRTAMEKLEEQLAQKTAVHISRDSDLTPKAGSGSQPEIVN